MNRNQCLNVTRSCGAGKDWVDEHGEKTCARSVMKRTHEFCVDDEAVVVAFVSNIMMIIFLTMIVSMIISSSSLLLISLSSQMIVTVVEYRYP